MDDVNLLILLLKRINSDNSIYVYKEEYTVSHLHNLIKIILIK